MEQSTLTLAVFSVVAVVIVVCAVGVAHTGDVIKTTSSIQQRKCLCMISYLDNYGNVFDTFAQEVRAKSRGAINDVSCNNRCQNMFSQKRGKVVTGIALPIKP